MSGTGTLNRTEGLNVSSSLRRRLDTCQVPVGDLGEGTGGALVSQIVWQDFARPPKI